MVKWTEQLKQHNMILLIYIIIRYAVLHHCGNDYYVHMIISEYDSKWIWEYVTMIISDDDNKWKL